MQWLFLLAVTYCVVDEAYWRLIRPPTSWEQYEGEWALVTGSSYGIGRNFAIELASRGMNVVIHGRSGSKLKIVSDEITSKYPNIKVKIIVQDVVENPDWDKMKELVEDLKITVLVNNVGGGTLDGKFLKIHERDPHYHQKVHQFNFGAVIGWTSVVLPKMVAIGRGRILSCSSLGYLFGYAESVYGADKAAINSFSLNLNNEYKDLGIRAESLIIGLVSTPATLVDADFFSLVESSELIAQNSLNLFGWREIFAPSFVHGLLHAVGKMLPTGIRADAARSGTEDIMDNVKRAREEINNKREL